ncbi:cytochrome P450 6k1-like [Bombyx mandarina]|uniref:unspecific monooxygenase n=1 Tax=Bombyx mandarina TaxID=7092 RepID=A0A6J2KD55_BOMMA|nr:cytochrome P450 6k1-like [Bombyx mandarina]
MLFIIIFIFILLLLTWWLIRWQQVKSYWAARNVPHEPPHPVLGSLTFLQKENPSIWLIKLYKKFPFPYIGIWLFWKPALIINSPELARQILTKDADTFRNRFSNAGKSDPVGALNLFMINDPVWSSVRRRLTPVFTKLKLQALYPILIRKSNDLKKRIKEDTEKNIKINLRSLFVDYSTDILGEAAFGVSSNSITTGESAMREVTKDFMKFDWLRGLQWSCIFFFPELADFFRCKLFPKESLKILRKIYRTMVAERSKSQSISGKSKDLLDALMAMKIEAAAENEVYNEDLLFAQATLFVQAGFETTSSAITFAIYELAYNPEIQERLYREIVEAKQKMEGNELDGVVLSNLQYLNCVINETLRKYPSLGWLDRVSSQSYKVDDTLTVPAGTAVYVNVAGIQSDPQLFPKPEEFIPERFNTDNNNIKPFTFIPFGEGPRQCIGIRFGYQTIQFGLSAIILNFKLRPIEGSPLPNNCHIESKGFVYTADHPLHIQFVPRN